MAKEVILGSRRTLTFLKDGRLTGLGTESLRSGNVDAVRGFCKNDHISEESAFKLSQ